MTRRLLLAVFMALCAAVVLAQGPLTPIGQLKGRTDAAGSLYAVAAAVSGAQGPLTPIAQLRGRTDASGSLYVTVAGGTVTPDTVCLDATNQDTCLVRDAADTLAQRRGTNLQKLSVYRTFTDASNYERLSLIPGTTNFLSSENAGTGTYRALNLAGASVGFDTGASGGAATTRWRVAGDGMFIAVADNSYDIGATGATRPRSLYLAAPSVTQGSATGLTITNTGEARTLVYKVTVATTAFVCAATTCDLTIGTLPANTWLTNAIAQVTTTFACTATCTTGTLSMILGKGAGGAEYLASFDADAATAYFGDADAEMGTLMTRAAAIQGGTFTSGTQAVVLRLTSGTGNIGSGSVTNLSQGALTIWITTNKLP